MDREERVERVARHTEELLTREELGELFGRSERPRAYIGFEPSGRLTVGHLVCARKMIDLQEAGCELTVFLADWHAWINDKLGGSLERIEAAGRYMRSAFQALGVSEDATRWRWAHELTGSSEYWSRVVRIAKTTSLARTKRAMTILGRSEEEEGLDTAKLFYPSMQAADIFELPAEIAYAGLDQRRAHVLAREVAHHYDWPVPVAVHTPLISSLKGGGRMNDSAGIERKMSKSDPTGSITLPSPPEEIAARLKGAFCPAKEVDGNPVVELALHVVFPWRGRLTVPRAPQHGGDRTFEHRAAFHAAWTAGEIHPADLKSAIASELGEILRPLNDYFAHRPTEAPAAF
ncbi:MAG TPA: tyrosine--tRNA ligase [Thermoplasmata archaeon]|nr:tyrosine--tRNA ligase [Thermoplasmata archaeon]